MVDLWQALIEHHRELGASDRDLSRTPEERRAGLLSELERALDDSSCLVLVAEDQPDAGLLGFLFAEIEPGSLVVIHELFVAPALRRTGIGKQLVESALDRLAARRPSRISVRIEVTNADARAFWSALGFAERAALFERPGNA